MQVSWFIWKLSTNVRTEWIMMNLDSSKLRRDWMRNGNSMFWRRVFFFFFISSCLLLAHCSKLVPKMAFKSCNLLGNLKFTDQDWICSSVCLLYRTPKAPQPYVLYTTRRTIANGNFSRFYLFPFHGFRKANFTQKYDFLLWKLV